jgi:hypothetical protein
MVLRTNIFIFETSLTNDGELGIRRAEAVMYKCLIE